MACVHVGLSAEPLDLQRLIDKCKTPDSGAVSVFQGVTRDNFNGKKVTYLAYEAYTDMAVKSLEEIANEAMKKFNLNGIGIEHRVGEVPISEPSINIVACSSHRKEAMEGSMWAIDTVKAKTPIWKKEFYEGEGEELAKWKSNAEFKESASKANY